MASVRFSELPVIVGIGQTKYTREKESDVIANVAMSVRMAADDAGLRLTDIDGLFVNNV